MLATYDDVVRCYQIFLCRPPESDDVIYGHIDKKAKIWDLIKEFIDSDEFMRTLKGRNHLSINKCFGSDYLSKTFDGKTKVCCFLNHHRIFQRDMAFRYAEKILFDEAVFLEDTVKDFAFSVVIFATKDAVNEGELSLEFRAAGKTLYRMSFSFISGEALGQSGDRQGVLISRMQGRPGEMADIRAATKALREVSPQSLLFAIIEGIASAAHCCFIAGVGAENHFSCTDDTKAIFVKTYDAFYGSIDAAEHVAGFYVMDLPLRQKPLTLINAVHRVRSKKKREFKASITAKAKQTWSSWATDVQGVPASNAMPSPAGNAGSHDHGASLGPART